MVETYRGRRKCAATQQSTTDTGGTTWTLLLLSPTMRGSHPDMTCSVFLHSRRTRCRTLKSTWLTYRRVMTEAMSKLRGARLPSLCRPRLVMSLVRRP